MSGTFRSIRRWVPGRAPAGSGDQDVLAAMGADILYRAEISSLTTVTPGTCRMTARAADRSAASVTDPDKVTTPS